MVDSSITILKSGNESDLPAGKENFYQSIKFQNLKSWAKNNIGEKSVVKTDFQYSHAGLNKNYKAYLVPLSNFLKKDT